MVPRGYKKTAQREIIPQIRAIIIFCRLVHNLTYAEIAKQIHISTSTITKIWLRTKERALDNTL